nr:capsid protein [Lingue ampelovirus 1]
MANLADVNVNDKVSELSTNFSYIAKLKGKIDTNRLRNDGPSSAADQALPDLPTFDYYSIDTDPLSQAASIAGSSSGKQKTAAASPIPGEGVFEEKLEVVGTGNELFSKLGTTTVLDAKFFGPLVARPGVEPGTMDNFTAENVSKSLRSLQAGLMGDTSNDAMLAFILAFLQNLVTYYTSVDMEVKDEYGVTIGYRGSPFLSYASIKAAVENATTAKSYENPLRQYARLFTGTVISLINNGKLQPNYKVAAQHGVVRRYVAYTLDFLRPNYLLYNPNQIRAWQLAQQSAFSRKTGSNKNTLHNTSELGSSAE